MTDVLNLFRATDIPQVVKSLGPEQQDVLMYYLYAGMAKPELYNSSVLLTWHEKVRYETSHNNLFFIYIKPSGLFS